MNHKLLRRTPGLLLAASACAGIALGGCQSERRHGVVEASSRAAPAVAVVMPRVVRLDAATLAGVVQPSVSTSISSPADGVVESLYAGPGARVTAGQVLAEIQPPTPTAGSDLPQIPAPLLAVVPTTSAPPRSGQDVARETASVRQARAQLTAAEATLTAAQASRSQSQSALSEARRTLDSQRTMLQQAQNQLDRATTKSRQYQDYYQQGLISRNEADQARTAAVTAQAEVNGAQATVASAQASVTSAQQAATSGDKAVAAAEQDVTAARNSLQAAQKALGSAQAAQKAQHAAGPPAPAAAPHVTTPVPRRPARRARPKPVKVTAPFNGIITARTVTPGALVRSGSGAAPPTPLFEIGSTDQVRIDIEAAQALAATPRPDTLATVTVRELPGKTFGGSVARRTGAATTSADKVPLEVTVSNPGHALKPGMRAEVRLTSARPVSQVWIPRTALLPGPPPQVAVVQPDGVVRLQPVRTGRTVGSEVQAVSGLTGGERLAADPRRVSAGERVP